MAANAITIVIVIGVALAGLAAWGERTFRGAGPLPETRLFTVPRGATLDRVADALEREGVIASAPVFRIGARLAGKAESLRYGEYEVPAAASMEAILELFASGRVIQYPVTVAEGLTSWEVVEILRATEVLTGEIAEIPPEGSLAPDTYMVQRGDERGELIARMQRLQRQTLEEAWAVRGEGLMVRSPEEALVLASIIEKETGLAAERGRISGVFHNRLSRRMRLQSDPTVIYGVTEGRGRLDRPLRRSELDARTRWNTYQIDGLPPTPIANPGREAILAAVRPEPTDELYFVADGTGGHAFARTLTEHNRNVAAWRAIERQRASEGQ